ncbi:DUF2971 domain-containing protein [Pseudomonas syringae group sp. J309-1]|uniref:DUF2971 domain-containing protein n=1 Tax=Pseudomonas syringae group sp. J309-1 TaxID=3079588 RepID=UPI00290F7178|nr:DUF2971 domain-containing protein [Pseudomonas syringae group sp. J309-1]MDU8358453.1 DUF2971 domain-containing protein [Pseudomonas syringae group sp. J309-1]
MGREPKSLYKYLSFSDRMVEQLYHGKVFYADPGTFNDPLDCRPVVVAGNQTIDELQLLLKLMVVRRVEKESSAALKRLKLKGDKLDLHRARLGESEVQDVIRGIEYSITDPDIIDPAGYFQRALLALIQTEVKETLATGVLCLSAAATSPLMWSHYGQQHRGVCIEYDVSNLRLAPIRKVVYGQSREVSAECVLRWLQDGDLESRLEVERAALLTKSAEWRYEKEWRLLGPIGLGRSPFGVKSVTFGMNCPSAIIESTMSMLGGEKAAVKFWRIMEPTSNFKLKRERIHFDDSMKPVLDEDYSWFLDDLAELDA